MSLFRPKDSRYWWYSFYFDGERYRKSTKKTKKTAAAVVEATYTMEKSGNGFAVSKSMGHADLKSMEPYQHQELEPLRVAINQRNRRKKFGQVLENAS